MKQRTFHGPITPQDIANALIATYNRGNLRTKKIGRGENIVVQIASPQAPTSGGQTAIAVHLTQVEDGVSISLGEQAWLGIAASVGVTVLSALRNPISILGRLDDLAQDVSSIQLVDSIWKTIEETADDLGASYEISERLRRLTCAYCQTANPVGAPHCIACGAPLGPAQPKACPACGFIVDPDWTICPECGASIP